MRVNTHTHTSHTGMHTQRLPDSYHLLLIYCMILGWPLTFLDPALLMDQWSIWTCYRLSSWNSNPRLWTRTIHIGKKRASAKGTEKLIPKESKIIMQITSRGFTQEECICDEKVFFSFFMGLKSPSPILSPPHMSALPTSLLPSPPPLFSSYPFLLFSCSMTSQI